jgi:hypothetical protein
MSSLLVFNRVYRLVIKSVILLFSTPLVNCCPSIFSLTSPIPTPTSQSKLTVCGCGGVWVLSCVVDHILQEFNTLFLIRFETYKIATSPQTKAPVKTTFWDRCLYSSFLLALKPPPSPSPMKRVSPFLNFNTGMLYIIFFIFHFLTHFFLLPPQIN